MIVRVVHSTHTRRMPLSMVRIAGSAALSLLMVTGCSSPATPVAASSSLPPVGVTPAPSPTPTASVPAVLPANASPFSGRAGGAVPALQSGLSSSETRGSATRNALARRVLRPLTGGMRR